MAALGYVSLEDNSIMNCLSSELFDSSKDVGFNYKSFKIDDLYDLIFLIKLNHDYTVNSVYLHYGNSNKIYLNIFN